MSHKLRIGGRAAAIGAVTALILVGLAAPGIAVAPNAIPVVTTVSPASGPIGCGITITGSSFQTPTVTGVQFGGVNAASYTVVSDSRIDAIVPGGTPASAPVVPAATSAVIWVDETLA